MSINNSDLMRINKRLVKKSTNKFQIYYQSSENWNKLSYLEKWLINYTGRLDKQQHKVMQNFINEYYSCGHDGYEILNGLTYIMRY